MLALRAALAVVEGTNHAGGAGGAIEGARALESLRSRVGPRREKEEEQVRFGGLSGAEHLALGSPPRSLAFSPLLRKERRPS